MSWYQPQKGKGKNTDVIAINYSEELQSRITEAVKGTKPSGDSKIKKPDFNLHLKEDCCKKILCDQTTVNQGCPSKPTFSTQQNVYWSKGFKVGLIRNVNKTIIKIHIMKPSDSLWCPHSVLPATVSSEFPLLWSQDIWWSLSGPGQMFQSACNPGSDR